MKKTFRVGSAKTISTVLAASLMFALIPKIAGSNTVLAASGSKNQDNTSLGVSAIVNPTPPENSFSTWTGSFVYFGNYNGPIKFRVLQKGSTAHTNSEALFLDSDEILKDMEFGSTNKWSTSYVKTWLNEDFFTIDNFTSIEMAAVPDTKTEKEHDYEDELLSNWYGKYVPLSGEKVFVLDAEEVMDSTYGYYDKRDSCASREKKGGRFGYWWLRSAEADLEHNAGDIYVLGDLSGNDVRLDNVGVAPALNVDQGSIIFTTKVAGENNAYKLTLSDSNLTIAVPDGKDIDVTGTNVTVPYEIGGAHAGNATRASVLITDDSGDNILFYDELGASSALDGTFPLPDGCDLIGWGKDYHVYILAEDINGEKETDYASSFVRLDKPAKIHEISVNVTTYDSDGKTKISETGGTATVSAASAVEGDKITVTATPESGFTLKSIAWGDGNSSTDITYPKEFKVKDSDAVVEVVFEKEVIIKDQSNTSLGVTAIDNPTAPENAFSLWTGSFVYFGKYNGTPLKFRVLQKDSDAHTTSSALFLDCDAILRDIEFGGSNKWADSYVKRWLNEDFLTSANFTPMEVDAVPDTKTEQEHKLTNSVISGWYGNYVPLSGEKAFVLDAEEATNTKYGYSSGRDSCACRKKVGGRNNYWWLRSAVVDDYHNTAGDIYVDGDLSENDIRIDAAGIAPALNVDQGSIIFTTKVAGENNAYKLTLSDSNLTIAVPDGKDIDITGTTVTVPYEIGGAHAGNATRASILITDDTGNKILLYDELGASSAPGGSFTLPDGCDLSGWGKDYHVYIIAEDINGVRETDYASAFVRLDKPAKIHEISVNVTTYDSDGKTKISEAGGTATVSAATAIEGDKITVTATPESGYILKSIAWGDGKSSTDITDAKEFTLGSSDAVVEVVFEKEEIKPVINTYTVIKGADGTWDGKSDYVIEVQSSTDDEHCIDRFDSVTNDGTKLTVGTDCTVTKGSTVITFKSDYLKSLSAGTHNIVVNFTDNSVATTLTVTAPSTPNTNTNIPATGEIQSPLTYIGIAMIVATCGITCIIACRKKRETA